MELAIAAIAVWLMVSGAFLYFTAATQRTLIETELGRETGTLHRIVSQRADQHDAHLTSLSAGECRRNASDRTSDPGRERHSTVLSQGQEIDLVSLHPTCLR